MYVYDVTRMLEAGMPTWPGEAGPKLTPIKRMAAGDAADVSHLGLGLHTGTHVDAPKHFIPGGGGAELLPLDVLIGPARVVAIRDEVYLAIERRAEIFDVLAAHGIPIHGNQSMCRIITWNEPHATLALA